MCERYIQEKILEKISESLVEKEKTVLFVLGEPGSCKTLFSEKMISFLQKKGKRGSRFDLAESKSLGFSSIYDPETGRTMLPEKIADNVLGFAEKHNDKDVILIEQTLSDRFLEALLGGVLEKIADTAGVGFVFLKVRENKMKNLAEKGFCGKNGKYPSVCLQKKKTDNIFDFL